MSYIEFPQRRALRAREVSGLSRTQLRGSIRLPAALRLAQAGIFFACPPLEGANDFLMGKGVVNE